MIFPVTANMPIGMRASCAVLMISVLFQGLVPTVGAQDASVPHHDVSFVSQGVTLRGTLYIPDETPFAAAVWIENLCLDACRLEYSGEPPNTQRRREKRIFAAIRIVWTDQQY